MIWIKMKYQAELVTNDQVDAYLGKLIGRVFKIIPMSEEKVRTLDVYVDSISREILGNSKLFLGDEMLCISGTLNGLNYQNHKLLKSDVFKSIELIEKARERVR